MGAKLSSTSCSREYQNVCLGFFCPIYLFKSVCTHVWGFPSGTVVKNAPSNAGDVGSVPRSERSPEEGNGNPLEYSCLENSMDRRAWQATVHGVTKSWMDTTKRVNSHAGTHVSLFYTLSYNPVLCYLLFTSF